ncbi:MAG: hypothetical protein V9G20_01340 [Candidatus Promineifilaceae bacterium]
MPDVPILGYLGNSFRTASYEVVTDTVRFLGSNGNSNGNADSGTAGYDAEEEEIPF